MKSYIIWDLVSDPPKNSFGILYSSYDLKNLDKFVSLPEFVEDNAESIKADYLNFIYKLGMMEHNGAKLIEYFQLNDNYNYWWSTLINEKSNFSKSKWIKDAIKLIAIEKIFDEGKIQKVDLYSKNKSLEESLRLLCIEKEIIFKSIQNEDSFEEVESQISFFEYLPLIMQSILWAMQFILRNMKLKKSTNKSTEGFNAEITFINYFNRQNFAQNKLNQFKSSYWTKIPDLLRKKKIKSNWLHIDLDYSSNAIFASNKHASEKFNNLSKYQNHISIFQLLNLKIILIVIKDWIKLLYNGFFIKHLNLKSLKKQCYLAPYIESDLKESIYGRSSLQNLFLYRLFEETFNIIPDQKKCFFLQENQGWEFGLIQSWSAQNKANKLFGVPHSTVRFWDLRYFFDKKLYSCEKRFQIPRPSHIAINGKVAYDMYVNGGYPESELIIVEALRFLENLEPGIDSNNKSRIDNNCILILGDYEIGSTALQLKLMEDAVSDLNYPIKVMFKPHPRTPININNYPLLNLQITKMSIKELSATCKIAFTSNMTSAALDAYYLGFNIISVLDGSDLNMSPMRNNPGINFISNSKQLIDVLKKLKQRKRDEDIAKDYFLFNDKLSNWQKLLIE